LLNTYDTFFAIYLQPILRDHFRKSNLALASIYVDSTSALITSLLPMLRRKIYALLPRVANQPQLLSHLIHELISFDVSLRDEWSYDGGNSLEGWRGLTWEVLAKKELFGLWLEVEKNCMSSSHHPECSLMFFKSLCRGTRPSLMLKKASRSTMIVLMQAPRSLRMQPLGSMTCSRPLQVDCSANKHQVHR